MVVLVCFQIAVMVVAQLMFFTRVIALFMVVAMALVLALPWGSRAGVSGGYGF